MRLSDLADLAELGKAAGPFASVTLDATAVDRASGGDVEQRWAVIERELRENGAPDEVV